MTICRCPCGRDATIGTEDDHLIPSHVCWRYLGPSAAISVCRALSPAAVGRYLDPSTVILDRRPLSRPSQVIRIVEPITVNIQGSPLIPSVFTKVGELWNNSSAPEQFVRSIGVISDRRATIEVPTRRTLSSTVNYHPQRALASTPASLPTQDLSYAFPVLFFGPPTPG